MSIQIFLLYLAAWSLAAISPGPAVMCAMAQSTRHGFRSSLAGILGIQLGSFLLFAGVALGLGTILAQATMAFTVLRVLGAVYLFFLGIRILLASFRSPLFPTSQPAKVAHQNLFVQGLLIQISNPKALLFISALLPQFIEAQRSVPLQFVLLFLATVVVDVAVLSSYAFFAQRGIQRFRGSRVSGWLERAFGAALIAFGCRLLVARK